MHFTNAAVLHIHINLNLSTIDSVTKVWTPNMNKSRNKTEGCVNIYWNQSYYDNKKNPIEAHVLGIMYC
jgi:hypothetical protein